jgi:methyltransferase-like protein
MNKRYKKHIENQKTYDVLPYISYPFSYTTPEHLASVSSIFGITPPKIETARVLEIGSGAGMGLIPFALRHPESKSLGIDLSSVEITHAIEVLQEIKLKNIEFKHMSCTDIDDSFGKFDYIICHGVFSWVEERVRDKILQICRNNLSENGLAFISYNTFPGWNMAGTVKDMMQFHSSGFEGMGDKILQAKAFITFVRESLGGTKSPFAEFLNQEVNYISQQQDSYIYHEYVEGINQPMYFYQFVDLIKAKGLNYVCDAFVAKMFSGNLAPKAQEKLSKINDITFSEQYIDFINNTRFRCSIICHDNKKPQYQVNPDILESFYLSLDLKPLEVESLDESQKSLEALFYLNNNKDLTISTTDLNMKAILQVFCELENYPTKISDIVKLVCEKLAAPNMASQIALQLKQETIKLLFNGYLQITVVKPCFVNFISEHPQVSSLAGYQAEKATENTLWVANQKSEIFHINLLDKHLLVHLDGKHTQKDLLAKLKQDVLDKKFDIIVGDKPLKDEVEINKHLDALLMQALQKFRKCSMLIA